jgi:hypothetical protein
MSANFMAPGAQQKRLAAYFDGLAQAAGHCQSPQFRPALKSTTLERRREFYLL